ncbi:hypothetical protein KC19_4G109400 [Ceratodon purpureus]|uniref:aminodeoxychorismate synthase n=1 Tax=Ceratodon purpureus TaxID=3225 RepID=A0A8T0I9I4_CERPU|nr:hypothetical protein KC19_4G109400 [Ceratodon purpureus]
MAQMAANSLSYTPVTRARSLLLKPSVDVGRLGSLSRCRTPKLAAPLFVRNAGKMQWSSLGRISRAEYSNGAARVDGGAVREPIRTLILDNYDSYTYNIFQLLSVINGAVPVVLKNDEITFEQLRTLLYEERAFHNVVISPGPGSPTRAEDIGISMRLLKECPDIPILGVCLGHQALGSCHGGKVVHAPEPVHGRLSEIEHNGHPLFNDIPSGAGSGFKVVRYHSLVIDAASLPEDLIPTAWTMLSDAPGVDCVNGSSSGLPDERLWMTGRPALSTGRNQEIVLMGMSHRNRPHHGVQFHPESVATAYGKQILENFRTITEEYWQRHDWQPGNKSSQVFRIPALPSNQENPTNLPDETRIPCHSSDHSSPIQLRVCWEKLPGYAAAAGGSENIFCDLFGKEAAQDTFWLDSSTREQGGARFSYMGGRGGVLWRRLTYSLGGTGASGIIQIEDASGNKEEHFLEDGFLNYLNKEMELRSCAQADYEDLPFDFCGGFVGYLGYELKVECGVRSNRHKSKLPDAALFLADRAVVVDHSNDDVYVLALFQPTTSTLNESIVAGRMGTSNGNSLQQGQNGYFSHSAEPSNGTANGCGSKLNGSSNGHGGLNKSGSWPPVLNREKSAAEEWVATTLKKISSLGKNGVYLASERRQSSQFSSVIDTGKEKFTPPFTLEKSRTTYINDVNECKRYIYDGESYEVCLTTQLRRETRDLDTLGLYLTLRKMNPAPYASWLHFGEHGPQVCCSSPERFLRLDRGGTLEAKPIKGTLPRGTSPAEDERLRFELQHSEKDFAENLMIVDLLRNDLGRVSVPGSVHVPSLMAVESYTTVHTLVSTVRGKKRDDVTPIECIKAAFPGGSMTGAPKLRTMEILDGIESGARGIYSGTVGFFSFNSAFDLNIVIRTLVFSDGEVCIGAGGAVTALSDPEGEYEEMLLKTRAPIRAMAKFEGDYTASNSQGNRGATAALPN